MMDAGTVARGVLSRLGGPRLPIRASSVAFLDSPAAFYRALLDGARTSRRRVRLCALYVGTGELERALARELAAAAARGSPGQPSPRVTVLLDRMRACRPDGPGGACSVDLLAPLVTQPDGEGAGGGVEVALFHPPALTGLALLLPPRVIEAMCVQHMKVFLFDDTVLLSGANLSTDYFTVRHDRYLRLTAETHVADFFDALLDAVGECSYSVRPAAAAAAGSRARGEQRPLGAGAAAAAAAPAEGGGAQGGGEPWARLALELVPPRGMPAPGRAAAAAAGAAVSARLLRLLESACTASEEGQQPAQRPQLAAGSRQPAQPGKDGGHARGSAPGAAAFGSVGTGAARSAPPAADTWLLPSVQLGSAGLRHAEAAMAAVLRMPAQHGGTLTLSSPYPNLTDRAIDALAGDGGERAAGAVGGGRAAGSVVLLSGSLASNGFARASGLARHVPMAYALLEARALRALRQRRAVRGARVPAASLLHWERQREGVRWTFHTKGLWYSPPLAGAHSGAAQAERPPVLSVVGSSNFGARSAERDLECNVALVSSNPRLRTLLAHELRRLRAEATPCTAAEAERRVGGCSAAFRWLVERVLAPFL